MKFIAFVAAASFAALPLFSSAALADEAQELSIAATHAGLAGKAAAIDGVHMHLHHALNCLVGPAGAGFDPTNANPCGKAGNGAIPDGSEAQKEKLKTAVASAESGIAATDIAAAKKDAADTAAAIDAAK